MAKQKKQLNAVSLPNKKASYLYTIAETYTTGIVLHGAEVKALRLAKASLSSSHCYFQGQELWLKGLHISEYMPTPHHHYDPDRPRKLLLHRHELRKLHKKKQEKGFTIVPLKIFTNDKNLIKVTIGLAKGKKLHDKRATIKERDLIRKEASPDSAF